MQSVLLHLYTSYLELFKTYCMLYLTHFTSKSKLKSRIHTSERLEYFYIFWLLSIIQPFGISMRIVVQRVTSASVTVDGKIVSSIGVSCMYKR